MNEEIKTLTEDQEVIQKETETQEPKNSSSKESDYSPEELKALEMGWRPKEEFEGNEEDFIDAKEFIRRKPLFDKINDQGKILRQTVKALEAMKKHYSEMREVEFDRALKALKNERKAALSEGDGDKFEYLDDQIKKVEEQVEIVRQEKLTPIVQEEQVHPELKAWISRNSWYDNVGYMRAFADDLGRRLAGTMPPGEVLKTIEKKVREEFPQKFRNSAKDSAPDVNRSTGRGTQKKSDDLPLTEVEKAVMRTLTSGKNPVMTKEAYLADLRKKKGIA